MSTYQERSEDHREWMAEQQEKEVESRFAAIEERLADLEAFAESYGLPMDALLAGTRHGVKGSAKALREIEAKGKPPSMVEQVKALAAAKVAPEKIKEHQ